MPTGTAAAQAGSSTSGKHSYEVAQYTEQGVKLDVIFMGKQFGAAPESAEKAGWLLLQECASEAGASGTVVPVWDSGGGLLEYLAPIKWHPYFSSVTLTDLESKINRKLTCNFGGTSGANATGTPTPEAPTPTAPSTAALMYQNAPIPLTPGKAGVVGVVATGEYDGNELPVVIQNNTSGPVHDIHITGEAHDSSGKLIATGSDQELYPFTVDPGKHAIGYVYFNGANIPAGSTFALNVTSNPGVRGQFDNAVDLNVKDANVSEGSVVGEVTDPTGKGVQGPLGVMVMCFSPSGQILGEHDSFADANNLTPAGSSPFTIDLAGGSCPDFIVGGGGFTQ